MDPINIVINERIARFHDEVDSDRLMRELRKGDGRAVEPSWTERLRGRVANTLIAAGELVRPSFKRRSFDRAA